MIEKISCHSLHTITPLGPTGESMIVRALFRRVRVFAADFGLELVIALFSENSPLLPPLSTHFDTSAFHAQQLRHCRAASVWRGFLHFPRW